MSEQIQSAKKRNVLLLRSSSDDSSTCPDRYTSSIESVGFHVLDVPTLTFQYQNLNTLRQNLLAPTNFSGLVFTSPRAVSATKECLQGIDVLDEWRSRSCYVVGERTGALVSDLLGLSSRGSDAGNAANLAELIVSDLVGGCAAPLLFPSGNLKRETLPTRLAEAGIPLQVCTVYTTCPHPDISRRLEHALACRPQFVVYFSPSSVNFSVDFQKECDCFEELKHVAIGPSTKEALEKHGLSVFGTAVKPSPEAVVSVLLNNEH